MAVVTSDHHAARLVFQSVSVLIDLVRSAIARDKPFAVCRTSSFGGRDGAGIHSARLAAVLQRAPGVPAVHGDPGADPATVALRVRLAGELPG